jgi:nitroimidazol reductase NimA-like FMN-containing flavoprotein (pyridoxamine 5'-phosphate oxidase superfamily)
MEVDVEKVVREYLPQVVHLSLGTSKDNKPWVCEVHFAYDENLNLYFRSLASRRHSQEIAENPNVAGNIVKQHSLDDTVVGVYFEGTCKMLETGDEQNKAFECIGGRMGTGEEILEEAKRDDGHKFYKITVDNWYVFGRFGGPSGQKHKLVWSGGKK